MNPCKNGKTKMDVESTPNTFTMSELTFQEEHLVGGRK